MSKSQKRKAKDQAKAIREGKVANARPPRVKTEEPRTEPAGFALLPQKVTDVDLAFPANVEHLMPKWEDIPEKYKIPNVHSRAHTIFYYGGQVASASKGDIDIRDAMRHLQCILRSFQPKHEHKMAAVDYLIDLWFEKFEVTVPAEKGGKSA